MTHRRAFLLSLAGGFAATGAQAVSRKPVTVTDKYGTRTYIPGKPPIMDFGGGLRIPLDKSALKTLWEGKDRWITFGAGNDPYAARAMYMAQTAATGMMKLMLLTLAFAPERLEHVAGNGWKLKSGNMKDLVVGDIDLPGKPAMPITDTYSSNAEAGEGHFDPNGSFTYIHAVTDYQVMKKDMSLETVRMRAQLL